MNVATNTFTDGLITDLNPLSTPNSVLTNCINGTITTYNGNEFALQNDLGNVKMEHIKFPVGFIPVGMKEYAGIIYVALLNPNTSDCQIGCFPSPGQLEPTDVSDLRDTNININQDSKVFDYKLISNELNPGDYYKLSLIEDASNTPEIKNYFNIVYNYITDNKKIPCNPNDIIISDEQQEAFNYFKGKSGSQLNVVFNKKEPDYFNVNIIPIIKKGITNTMNLSIWAKAYNKTIDLFKGIRIKCKVNDVEKTKYFESVQGDIIKLDEVILGLNKGETAIVEVTPYSKYHIFESNKYIETFDTTNIIDNPSINANNIFKYFASNEKISIDFDFKCDDPNLKLYIEAYDPIADCSTIKQIDQPTSTGINQVVFDLVNEKNELPIDISTNGISNELIRLKPDNEDMFKAILPINKGTDDNKKRYVRTKDQLRLNHYYVFRICAISTIGNEISYSYILKSLYTFDSFNQYYNTIKDFETLKLSTKDYLSFNYKINSDLLTGSEDGISEYDPDCSILSTQLEHKEIVPFSISSTLRDLHYTHYQTYNKKRDIDLSITCDSSKMFGTINDVTSSSDPNIFTTVKDDFIPVKKINNPSAGKQSGESSIFSSFIHLDKNLNHKLSFDYTSYRNSSAKSYDTNTTTSVSSYELYPLTPTFAIIDNNKNNLIINLGRQKGDCYYIFNGVQKYLWGGDSSRFDDDLYRLIPLLRTSDHFNKNNICACVTKPFYGHLYWVKGAFSEANDIAQQQGLNNYYGYKGDKRLHPWDSLMNTSGTNVYNSDCGLLVIHSKDESADRTMFLRIYNISDMNTFFNKVNVCAHKMGYFYCYYPRLTNGGFKNLSNSKTIYTHSVKIDTKLITGNLFNFKSFRDNQIRPFNLDSINSIINDSTISSLNKLTNQSLFPVLSNNEIKTIDIPVSDYVIEKASNGSVFDYWGLGYKGFINKTSTTPPVPNGSLYIKNNDLDLVKLARLKDFLEITDLNDNPFTDNSITENNFRINLKTPLSGHNGMWSNQEHRGNVDGPNFADNYFYKQ